MIRAKGRWWDCAPLADLWVANTSAGPIRNTMLARGGIMLELGGNLGACSIEMLVRTPASLVIFEPHPTNLFRLTSSIKLLATQVCRPDPPSSRRSLISLLVGCAAPALARG
jgi:hypothetical protein